MTRKLTVFFVFLLTFTLLVGTAFSKGLTRKVNHNRVKVGSVPTAKLAGAERSVGYIAVDDINDATNDANTNNNTLSLGYDQIESTSPGKQIGATTYDYQSNSRMQRQCGWRGNDLVHFAWMVGVVPPWRRQGIASALMRVTSALGLSPLGPYHALMYGRSLYFDLTKPREELGWSARRGTVEMFCESYDWYVENREAVLESRGASHHRSALNEGILSLVKRIL